MSGENFGQRLRRLRLRAGLTQEQLGATVGMTRQAVWNVENGRTQQPHVESIEKWAEELGVSTVYLATGREMLPPDFAAGWTVEAALRATTRLNPDVLDSVAKIVHRLEAIDDFDDPAFGPAFERDRRDSLRLSDADEVKEGE